LRGPGGPELAAESLRTTNRGVMQIAIGKLPALYRRSCRGQAASRASSEHRLHLTQSPFAKKMA
jgi:hypothetical protein